MILSHAVCMGTQNLAQHTYNMAITKRPLCYAARMAGTLSTTPAPKPPPMENGHLSSVLNRIQKDPREFVDKDWRPIADLDGYVEYARKRAKTLDEHVGIMKLINRHNKYHEENPPKIEEKSTRFIIPVRDTVDGVASRMNGDDPFTTFMNKDNTVDDYVEIYKKAGCSEDFLKRIRDAFAGREDDIRMRGEFLDRVLSKYSGKTNTKKKHVHVRDKMTSVMKIKGGIKEEDLE